MVLTWKWLLSRQTSSVCRCQFLDTLDKTALLSWGPEKYSVKVIVTPSQYYVSSVPAWIAGDMTISALHDGGKRYPGTHRAFKVCLQILWQHKRRVFSFLDIEEKRLKQACQLDTAKVLYLTISLGQMTSSLSVYHQVCNLLPTLLSMMAFNCTALPTRGRGAWLWQCLLFLLQPIWVIVVVVIEWWGKVALLSRILSVSIVIAPSMISTLMLHSVILIRSHRRAVMTIWDAPGLTPESSWCACAWTCYRAQGSTVSELLKQEMKFVPQL